MRTRLLMLPRETKRVLQVGVDILLLWLALWLAFVIRLGWANGIDPFVDYLWLYIAAPATGIPLFVRFGLYRAVLRYFGGSALLNIFNAISLSSLLLAVVIYLVSPDELMPRSVVFIYWGLALLMVGGLRLLMRQYFSGELFPFRLGASEPHRHLKRVAIYGAGAAGNQLLFALRMGKQVMPVAFIDDDTGIAGRVIAGLKVYSPESILSMLDELEVEEVLLAIPSASRGRRREILQQLEPFPVHVRTIPGFMDLASGKVSVSDLQEVDIVDLLGRDTVAPHVNLLEQCIRDQVVMVTGAGGSIGSELCRQILTIRPTTLILFEHSEFNLYRVQAELQTAIERTGLPIRLLAILGSVRDETRLREVMLNWEVDTLYHAAAYKHVPIVEHNMGEGLLNNLFGTLHTSQAAVAAGVKNFVLISTDKAVRPTNVMGSSKRLAEMVLQALSREDDPVLFDRVTSEQVPNRTRFTMVRFGNVLGSSGSVIPLFREQIARGGPVTVTHPNITRYFMTIPEAAQLVIQAGSMGQGGDVFVLDMGQPVKIVDLAEKMIHLSGMTMRSEQNPQGDVAIEFTGLRPGEKLYEELLIGDNVTATDHPMIMRASEDYLSWGELKGYLGRVLQAIRQDDCLELRQLLRMTVSGYCPDEEVVDWFHVQKRSAELLTKE